MFQAGSGETLLGFASKQEVKEGLGIPLGKAIKVWVAIEALKSSAVCCGAWRDMGVA